MGEKILGLDIDDVCADFMTGFVSANGMPARWGVYNIAELYPHISKTKMRKLLKHPGSYDVLPMPGAVAGVRYLRKWLTVKYITSRDKSLKGITEEWLDQHRFPAGELVLTSGHDQKVEFLKTTHLWGLVEDRGQTLLQAEKYVNHRYLFDRPWNRGFSSLPRYLSWNHLVDAISTDIVNELH